MWRFDLENLTEDDLRRLRLRVKLERAEAHIVVKSDRPWVSPIKTAPRQWQEPAAGVAIN